MVEQNDGSAVAPATGMNGVVNGESWVTMYTRDGRARQVPENEVNHAMSEEGLVLYKYNLDDAEKVWLAEMQAAMDVVPKALASGRATKYSREEDAWIISSSMAKVRDSFANLLFAHGSLLPSEGVISDLKDYIEAQGGKPDPSHNHLYAQCERYKEAIGNFPEDVRQSRHARSVADLKDSNDAHIAAGHVQVDDGNGGIRWVDPNSQEAGRFRAMVKKIFGV